MLTVESIAVDPPAEGEIVDPMMWFDAPGSFELEIGCGKGEFITTNRKTEVRALLEISGSQSLVADIFNFSTLMTFYCPKNYLNRSLIWRRVVREWLAVLAMVLLDPKRRVEVL